MLYRKYILIISYFLGQLAIADTMFGAKHATPKIIAAKTIM
jgi:hypothetical protein